MMHCNKFFQSLIRTLSTERLLCRLVAIFLVVQSTVALLVPLWVTNIADGKVVVLCSLLPSSYERANESDLPPDAPQVISCPLLMLGNAFTSVLPTSPHQVSFSAADFAVSAIAHTEAPRPLTHNGTHIRAPPPQSRPIVHV